MIAERSSEHVFLGTSALLFTGSATLTVSWSRSMAGMGGMPMPGGWAMSMIWMRMPGQTWLATAGGFLAMWIVMMAAMMLPSLVPMLRRYRDAVGPTGAWRLGRLTALAGLGYFFVWTMFGLAVYPLAVGLASLEMDMPAVARAVPAADGAVILVAGVLQRTAWKAQQLACCREAPFRDRLLRLDAGTACRLGMRFGLRCGLSCANLTAILLVAGVMDWRVMAVVTATITAERLTLSGDRIARASGGIGVGVGVALIIRAVGLPFGS